jgi:two-component system sensor histidine kinase TctE
VLDEHALPGTQDAGALADIHGAVNRLEALLMRLITLAHADEAVRGGISRSRIDLRSVVAQVTGDLIPLATQRDITLSVNAAERPAWVHAEPVLAAEILTNLVDNAIRYNLAGGNVCIGLDESTGFVDLSVEDDGPGIPAAEQKLIFERFYRSPRDQTQPGSGLGLSIVKTLSEALHAHVSIDTPSTGRGLRISVRFEPATR